ncbi:hypothetical protein FHS95_000689 [Sphingomonas naasensis]|uniref:hypothetical protein n=1 Tax=Sphingomonas naasensis TaxID=1344951 RepID=UPI00141B0D75|nr:hypothetical protein [Sphingomonas naasensis]NIJ19020.1 hypothetical protein [Sphingomonas naasensis]
MALPDTLSLPSPHDAARDRLDRAPLGALELARPPLDDLPYRDFVRALLARQGFKLDFNRLEPDAALALVSDQLLGPASFVRARALLAEEIATLAGFASHLAGGRASIAIRTSFAPGDLVWHVDRVQEARAVRLLWPIGRPAGMRVTPAANIDPDIYRAYMRREFPLLCQMDSRVLRTGAPVETLWAHRPEQLAAMTSGRFPFLLDREAECEVTPGAASIHRVQTPAQPGAWHRSAWANRHAPGMQIVITAASDS